TLPQLPGDFLPDMATPASTRRTYMQRPLSSLEWDILAGLLIGLSIGALSSVVTIIALPFTAYGYVLAKRGKAGSEAQMPAPLTQQRSTAPAALPQGQAIMPNFENTRLAARAASLDSTEQEVRTLLTEAKAKGIEDTSELTALLDDLSKLRSDLHLEERQVIHERTAELRGYVETLKAERQLGQQAAASDKLKL
ncbi:MAG: hypothetical protein Q4C67_10500, partial [Deinococcus sp.]|nr:hypothetical protein [Deinococcus sp.]